MFAISNLSVVKESSVFRKLMFSFGFPLIVRAAQNRRGFSYKDSVSLMLYCFFFLLISCFVERLKFLYFSRLAGLGNFLSSLLCMFSFLICPSSSLSIHEWSCALLMQYFLVCVYLRLKGTCHTSSKVSHQYYREQNINPNECWQVIL